MQYTAPGPIAKQFLKSDAFVCAIRGPIGSGKSTAGVMKLIRNVQKQAPHPETGWKFRRSAIIRNTFPELRTTTIKTFHQWVPTNVGNWRESGPPTHHIIDNANKTDWEVIFIALDRPDDVNKLLSMELSDAWINEAREVPLAIMEALTGRVGRFPPTIRDDDYNLIHTCTDPQIIMDTNSPDSDHWWYRFAEDPSPEDVESMMKLEAELRALGALREDQNLYEWYAQPGGEDPKAENLKNLAPGYYQKAKANKTKEWINVYIDNNYGYVQDGKPVYPDYNDRVHCVPFDANPRLPLHIGLDFGLTPAALFSQKQPNGQWRHHTELVTERAGIIRFARLIQKHMAEHYPGYKISQMTGDPSGNQAQGGDEEERTVFQLLAANGINCEPAHTNDPTLRREAFNRPLTTMIDGEPGFLVSPNCKVFRKGLQGGFCYKRIQVAGDSKYRDVPDKNKYSHICEAGEYSMMGAGEGKAIIKKEPDARRQKFAISDYDILD